jgi:hypothetical protein
LPAAIRLPVWLLHLRAGVPALADALSTPVSQALPCDSSGALDQLAFSPSSFVIQFPPNGWNLRAPMMVTASFPLAFPPKSIPGYK